MRKLATIRVVKDIQPIKDADNIEVLSIDGWKVVAKKGEHQIGEHLIYLEVDSWIPHTLAPFLSKGEPKIFEDISGERLRTVKLRGQISQGLVLPFSVLKSGNLRYPLISQVTSKVYFHISSLRPIKSVFRTYPLSMPTGTQRIAYGR